MKLIEMKNACKVYYKDKNEIYALNHIDVEFEEQGFYAIMGHSGSGKTTLVQILGMFDELSSGNYFFKGIDVSQLSEKEKAKIRNKEIGFVFQKFYLNDYLTAYENIMLPMLINDEIKEKKEKTLNLLKLVNLEERGNHYPKQMSGGECQRVAIARSLANDPKILLADEPTGNLDIKNEENIFEILKKISKERLVIVVSHNESIKQYADYVYYMDYGKIEKNEN